MRRGMGLVAALAGGMTVFASARVSADDSAKTGVGPIKSIQDLQDTAKMLFKLADTNNDGQISQKEATDAGNLLVGGFFFRADANGDGTLTHEEAQQARENLFQQQPLLRLVLQKATPKDVAVQPNAARPTPSTVDPATTAKQIAVNPEGTIGSLLDANHDQKIEATEIRQAVQTGVQTLFTFCDTNQDAQLTPYELNAAVGEAAKSAVQTVFQAADMDRNGQLSVEEYDKALAEPAHALFRVIDADNNNNLSLAEIQRAEQILADQIMRLRVPEPPNSISNAVKQSANSSTAAPTQTQAAAVPNPR
jgi:Ca2+-binding EF-hand superfamily protein